MIPNKYAGKCSKCGYEVAPDAGFYYPSDGHIEHSPKKCPKIIEVRVTVPEDRRDEILQTAIRMRGGPPASQRKYPFHKMGPGDWFEWPVEDNEKIQVVVQRLRVASAKQAARHGGAFKVTRNEDQTAVIVKRVEAD